MRPEKTLHIYFYFTHYNFDIASDNDWSIKIDKSH